MRNIAYTPTKQQSPVLFQGTPLFSERIEHAKYAIGIGTPNHIDQVTVGDDGRPQISLNRWQWGRGSTQLEVEFVTEESGQFKQSGNRLIWSGETLACRAYRVDPTFGFSGNVLNERGGLEFDVVLQHRPNTNVFAFRVHSPDLEWFYQPAEPSRSIEIVGSYAVYHRSRADAHKDKTTSPDIQLLGMHTKAFHVYRPFAVDALGKQTWCELYYEAGLLTITVPQVFLDDAIYPVVVDPTFGYTTVGASNLALSYVETDVTPGTSNPASSGTLQSVSAYGRESVNAPTHNPAIYSDNAGVPNTRLAFLDSGGTAWPTGGGGSEAWKTTALSAAITGGSTYWLGTITGVNNSHVFLWYDSVASASYYVNLGAQATWQNPHPGGAAGTRRYSIYGTYTTSAGPIIEHLVRRRHS